MICCDHTMSNCSKCTSPCNPANVDHCGLGPGVCCGEKNGEKECVRKAMDYGLPNASDSCVCNKFWTGDNCDIEFDDYMGHIITIARGCLVFVFAVMALVAVQQVLHEIHLGKTAARSKSNTGVGSLRFWLNFVAFFSAFLLATYDLIRTIEGSDTNTEEGYKTKPGYKIKKVLEQIAYSFTVLGLMILVVLVAEVDTSRSAKRAGYPEASTAMLMILNYLVLEACCTRASVRYRGFVAALTAQNCSKTKNRRLFSRLRSDHICSSSYVAWRI